MPREPFTVAPTASGDEGWARVFAFVGTVVGAGIILIYLKAILIPFVLAVFLAYLVRPFAEFISNNLCFFRRRRLLRNAYKPRDPVEAALDDDDDENASLLPKRVSDLPAALKRGATMGSQAVEEATQQVEAALPRWVGVLLAMVLSVFLVASVVVLMASSIASLGSRLDAYQQRAHDLWSIAAFHLRRFGLDLPDVFAFPSQAVSSSLAPLLNASLGLLNHTLLVFIFLVFLLLEQPSERSPLRKRIDNSVSSYLVLKSLICLGLAVFDFVVLTVLGFPLALFLSIATYILTFIPNLGPMVAVLLPLPICLFDASVPQGAAYLAFALPALAHVLVGNLLEPHLFGSQFRMSPVIILFALGVWTILWGMVGAMLAVPLTSIIRIICTDLLKDGNGGFYIQLLNQLLEGHPLDAGVIDGAARAEDAMVEEDLLGLEEQDAVAAKSV